MSINGSPTWYRESPLRQGCGDVWRTRWMTSRTIQGLGWSKWGGCHGRRGSLRIVDGAYLKFAKTFGATRRAAAEHIAHSDCAHLRTILQIYLPSYWRASTNLPSKRWTHPRPPSWQCRPTCQNCRLLQNDVPAQDLRSATRWSSRLQPLDLVHALDLRYGTAHPYDHRTDEPTRRCQSTDWPPCLRLLRLRTPEKPGTGT